MIIYLKAQANFYWKTSILDGVSHLPWVLNRLFINWAGKFYSNSSHSSFEFRGWNDPHRTKKNKNCSTKTWYIWCQMSSDKKECSKEHVHQHNLVERKFRPQLDVLNLWQPSGNKLKYSHINLKILTIQNLRNWENTRDSGGKENIFNIS